MFFFLAEAAKKTWKVLRQQFKLHFDKLPVVRSGGEPPEDIVEWPYFKSLMFLKDIFEKRPATGNLSDSEEKNENVVINSDEEQDTHNTDDDISPPPTPTSQTSSAGCSSEATKVLLVPRKADNLGYRKRSSQIEIIGKNLVDLEKEKIEMKKSKIDSNFDRNDEDIAFFTSLLPHVKKLSPVEKLQFRIKVQTILMESAYKDTTEKSRDISNSTLLSREPALPMTSSSTTHLLEMDSPHYTTLQPRGFDYNYNVSYKKS